MRMNQAQFSRHMSETREDFNDKLFERTDDDIIKPMLNVINSLNHDQFFTLNVVETEIIKDYEKIYDELREYVENHKKKNQKDNPYDYINLKDSAIMLLKVKFYIRKNGVDKIKIGKEELTFVNPDNVIDVLIALPRFVNKYYFKLSGSYYAITTQIVDGSTYNNATSASAKTDTVTFKLLFGMVIIYRRRKTLPDENTLVEVPVTEFTGTLFNNHNLVMLYLFARFGFYGCLSFFGLDGGVILVTDYLVTDENYWCFKKNNVYVSILKTYNQYDVFSSLACTIRDSIGRDTRAEDVFTFDYWLKALGQSFKNASVEKGLSILSSAEYLYEMQTQQELRVSDDSKADIFHILRWIITNFDAHMDKDNTDVSTKRRRIGETIAHLYSTKITGAIHRLCGYGRKVKLDQIRAAIAKDPMELLRNIASNKSMNNIISFDDRVNDDDAVAALRYTYKGISGLGENKGSVQFSYRLIDPSHLGILDLDAVRSDPGLSGLMVPLADTYGENNQFFSDYIEPDDWLKIIDEIHQANIADGILYPMDYPEIDYVHGYDYVREERKEEIVNHDCYVSPFIHIDDGNEAISKEKKKIASLFADYEDELIMDIPTDDDKKEEEEEGE